MAMTVEELAEKLEMEIAARKLLEHKVNAQSNSVSNAESRLNSQIQSVSSVLKSQMQNVEGLVSNESVLRTNGDATLNSSVTANASAIREETDARAVADENLQQQIQTNLTTTTLLQEAYAECKEDVDRVTTTLSEETIDRVEQQNSLKLAIQETQTDFSERLLTVMTKIDELNSKSNGIDDRVEAGVAARADINSKVQANLESIEKANQKIKFVEEKLDGATEKFVDETAVSTMINDSFSERFALQLEGIREILEEDKTAREADIENIQDYAARAQNASVLAQTTLDNYRQIAQAAALSMREAFNLLLPRGSILPYFGEIVNIPDGWALCNGANGTPNLVGKVLVGAHAVTEEGDEFACGNEGGEKEVKLTTDTMPQHYHYTGAAKEGNRGSVFINDLDDENKKTLKDVPLHNNLWGTRSWKGHGETTYVRSAATAVEKEVPVNTVTSGLVAESVAKSHNNMQPYFCVYYIMKMF